MTGSGPGAGWPETGALQLEGLSLAYREGAEPVLHDITCAVAPRDKVGIVGRTGAGKSTLTLGLFRLLFVHDIHLYNHGRSLNSRN